MDIEERKNKLTKREYIVTQKKGTETAFTGEHWDRREEGGYFCKVCEQKLFTSDTKLDSSQGPLGLRGWPAFDQAIPGTVEYLDDDKYGMHRTEAVCSKCKAHLGHIFNDEETETGKHLCINSCSLDFKPKEK
jgi:peptide-methionine (R)-S-oxide reductase